MKKLPASLMMMVLLSIAFVAGCGSSTPSHPTGPTVATATPTKTKTFTPTRTITSTPTLTPTGTLTPSVTPTPLVAQAMVNLASAGNYVVLAYTGVTNSGPTTLCGSLGLAPGSSVGGGIVINCGGVTDVANTAANTAKLDLSNAYTDAAGRTVCVLLAPGSDIGGLTLYPGLYTENSDLLLSSSDVTLDALGNVNAVFIFQVNGNLIADPGRQVILTGGTKASHVFWQVTGFAALDTTVSFAGNILAYTSVTLNTGAVLLGRALAENGNVTLLTNTITMPAP